MVGNIYGSAAPVATTSVPATRIRQQTDEGMIFFSLEPAKYNDTTGLDPGEPPVKRWNWAIGQPNFGFPGDGERPDRIVGFGYNISRHVGGTPTPQESPQDASFGFTFEDYYNLSGTARQFEYYLQSCPAGDDGSHQVRPYMIVVQYPTLESNTPHPGVGCFENVTGDQGRQIDIEARKTGTLGTFTSTTAGTMTASNSTHGIASGETGWTVRWANGTKERTGVTIGTVSGASIPFSGGSGDDLDNSVGMAMYLAKEATWLWQNASSASLQTWLAVSGKSGILFDNGVYALQQKLTNGTAKSMIAINAANYLDVGSTGIVKIRSQIIHDCPEGVATKYKTSAHAMADGDFYAGSPPVDGTFAITYNGGTSKLWVRTNGVWNNPLSW